MFRVGQRVVCIKADGLLSAKPLTLHAIYTIRSIWDDSIDGPGVCLEEVANEMHPRGEFGYRPHRFRPIVENKSDISIFTEMLKPNKVEA